MDYAVVIPAYNEAGTVRDIAERALKQTRHVIVVDDGSSDDTLMLLADCPVTLLRNQSNQGKAASLWRGMQHALTLRVEAVITLDADGQHAPEDIPRLVEAAFGHREHIIVGARSLDAVSMPAIRYYANRFANFWISWASGYRVRDSQSGFRLYPAALLKRVDVRRNRWHSFVFESEILIEAARLGYESRAVAIPTIYRPLGRPSYYRHRDSFRITLMVARKLLSRWLYPQGFYRAFLRSSRS